MKPNHLISYFITVRYASRRPLHPLYAMHMDMGTGPRNNLLNVGTCVQCLRAGLSSSRLAEAPLATGRVLEAELGDLVRVRVSGEGEGEGQG